MLKTVLSAKLSPPLLVASVIGRNPNHLKAPPPEMVTAMIDAFAVSAGGLSPAFVILPRPQSELEDKLPSRSVPRAPAEKVSVHSAWSAPARLLIAHLWSAFGRPPRIPRAVVQLEALDDHMLKDGGIHPSQIQSVASHGKPHQHI
jgi:uncharacterized protein YjiS (DUF1127 family)